MASCPAHLRTRSGGVSNAWVREITASSIGMRQRCGRKDPHPNKNCVGTVTPIIKKSMHFTIASGSNVRPISHRKNYENVGEIDGLASRRKTDYVIRAVRVDATLMLSFCTNPFVRNTVRIELRDCGATRIKCASPRNQQDKTDSAPTCGDTTYTYSIAGNR